MHARRRPIRSPGTKHVASLLYWLPDTAVFDQWAVSSIRRLMLSKPPPSPRTPAISCSRAARFSSSASRLLPIKCRNCGRRTASSRESNDRGGRGGATYKDVGIKLKGAAGSFRGFDDRPAVNGELADKYIRQQVFHDLEKFHLNNSVQDESYLNELCRTFFAPAGHPATGA